jgi:hypothetical protein
MFNEILDPLSVGHAKAEKILEERKRQAEDAEAVERLILRRLERQKREEAEGLWRQVRESGKRRKIGRIALWPFRAIPRHKAPRLENLGRQEDKRRR